MSRKRTPRGFTLIELLIVISIIAVMLAVLLPAINRARAQAKTMVCASQVRQIGLVLGRYCAEYNGFLPPETWYPWMSQMDRRNWGTGISWQHFLVNPSNPRASVTEHRGDRELAGIRCPYWPKALGGFGENFGSTGGYALNDNLDGLGAWQIVPGANPDRLRQSYITANIIRVRNPGTKIYALEITAYDSNNDGIPDYSKDTIDSWGWLDAVSTSGSKSYKYHGWLRIDHGQYRLSGPCAMQDLKVLPKNQLLNQKLNCLFVDQHVETVKLKSISENPNAWMPYK